jgi:hypothetical protein
MAAQAIKSALPTHLKPGNGNGDDSEFAKRHHGKTRSHMVSSADSGLSFWVVLFEALCGASGSNKGMTT